jgi:hypothetical protein
MQNFKECNRKNRTLQNSTMMFTEKHFFGLLNIEKEALCQPCVSPLALLFCCTVTARLSRWIASS